MIGLVAPAGCGGATSEPKTEPLEDTKPVRIVVVTAPASSGQVGTGGGEFVVRVENATGRGVRGVRVDFSSQTSAPFFNFAPSETTTDSTGVARTTVSFGIAPGTGGVAATAAGVTTPAIASVSLTPGPRALLITDKTSIRLYGPGDEASFTAWISDGFLNMLPDVDFQLTVSDSTLVSVTPPATPGGTGKIRSLKGGGTVTIRSAWSTGGGIEVSVNTMPRMACTGIATPAAFNYDVRLVTASDSTLCFEASSTRAEYALIVYNESTDGSTSLATTVTGYNVESTPFLTRSPSGELPRFSRSATLRRGARTRTLDLGFHARLLTQSRSLRRLFAPARAARSRAVGGRSGRITGPRLSYAAGGSATPVPAVDDLLSLNVAEASCTNADMRTFRVEAVGDKAIVLADTGNPANGFTRADYQRFAARFDTLVYPLDRDAFGEPSDIDGNAHVAILFTRAVNELTPAGSGAVVGGFFHPRDLFPRAQSSTAAGCQTSNEGEMFYMMVPDPVGVVNGNDFSQGLVDTLTTGVLAHELQHLINASRRMYVNTASEDFEALWLNEGLSHIAEELLYFRESGYFPRSGLSTQSITRSQAQWNTWVADDASNFVRFYLYLSDPANNSPIDAGDALETRGATWAFLRFAVDHSSSNDAATWQRFGNSTTTGLETLRYGLQQDPAPLLRDFAVANFPTPPNDIRFVHRSWDFDDVYGQVFVGGYPVPITLLPEATSVPISVRGGSASYYRFQVLPDVQPLLKFGSGQAPASSKLKFMVLRTR